MVFFRNGQALALLLIFTQGIVLASVEDEKDKVELLSKAIISSMQVPRIHRINSARLSEVENSCDEAIAAATEAYDAGLSWPMEMWDASSKVQSGIFYGNREDLGIYDQCIAVNGEYNGTNVQGKYCTVRSGKYSSAACVPSSCNEVDVAEIVNAAIQDLTEIIDLELKIDGVSCVPVGTDDFTTWEIITMIFFSVICGFIVFCTLCEFILKYRTAGVSPTISQLAKFSLCTNARSLLSTKVNPRMMPAIQGIRFLSMCWIVLGHRFSVSLFVPMINKFVIQDWYNSWTAAYVQAAPFAVETFFVISGFLLSFMFLKSKQSGKRTNYLMMYIHRYLRLTPAMAILMLFIAVLLHRVGYGPLWNNSLSTLVEPCRKNWWVNLLYVQNFVRADELCISHSWYLAVDMQLFWISPFILYPLNRWPKFGLGLLGLLLVGSIVTPAVLLATNDYFNSLLRIDRQNEQNTENMLGYYYPTYNRACAYLVGILLGYDAANKKRHFSLINVIINWAVACILLLLCGLSTKRAYSTSYEYDVVWETVFAIFLRPIWSVAIAWIVYACTHGYGGVVTWFLSLPIFLPLSRLSYSIYLVHMVIQQVKISSAQVPGRFSDFIMIDHVLSDLVLSIAIAFFFSLFFESPIVVLEKILTDRGRKRSPMREPKTDVEGGVDNKAMTES